MTIIEVDHVTKEFRLGELQTIKQGLQRWQARLRGQALPERANFNALDDVHFDVEEGDVLGIVGHNGAGKSTLLKLLSGITVPSRGVVNVRGKVAPLIEVGAGLVGDLTGRENIYLNGAVLGMPRKHIQAKFDEIVAFSELDEFIETPVKHYSSGMAVRLGFSIATTVDADILIVDEVLAVGDLAFQKKCFDRMEDLIRRRRKTVILVSHNIRQVERLCNRAFMLDHGRIVARGNVIDVCNSFYTGMNEVIRGEQAKAGALHNQTVVSSDEIHVTDISLFRGDSTENTDTIGFHEPIRIGIAFEAACDLPGLEIIVGFHTTDFVYVASTSSAMLAHQPTIHRGTHYIECVLADMVLVPGVYSVRLSFQDQFRRCMWDGHNLRPFHVAAGAANVTRMPQMTVTDLPFKWDFSGLHSGAETKRVPSSTSSGRQVGE